MARGRGSKMSSGGMLGGLHLMGGAVGVNTCDAKDDSFYCQYTRAFSMISMTFSLIMIVVLIYFFAKYFLLTKSKRR